jgi:hypothetical protein
MNTIRAKRKRVVLEVGKKLEIITYCILVAMLLSLPWCMVLASRLSEQRHVVVLEMLSEGNHLGSQICFWFGRRNYDRTCCDLEGSAFV